MKCGRRETTSKYLGIGSSTAMMLIFHRIIIYRCLQLETQESSNYCDQGWEPATSVQVAEITQGLVELFYCFNKPDLTDPISDKEPFLSLIRKLWYKCEPDVYADIS